MALLQEYGFTKVLDLGSSAVYEHPGRPGPPLTIPSRGPLQPALVKRVANAIEEVMLDET